MDIVSNLRTFRIAGYALFDFAAAFLGIIILSPLLTRVFRKIGLEIPLVSWILLTLPIGLATHLLIGKITPMTRNFLDLQGHYLLKVIIILMLVFGLCGVKRIKS